MSNNKKSTNTRTSSKTLDIIGSLGALHYLFKNTDNLNYAKIKDITSHLSEECGLKTIKTDQVSMILNFLKDNNTFLEQNFGISIGDNKGYFIDENIVSKEEMDIFKKMLEINYPNKDSTIYNVCSNTLNKISNLFLIDDNKIPNINTLRGKNKNVFDKLCESKHYRKEAIITTRKRQAPYNGCVYRIDPYSNTQYEVSIRDEGFKQNIRINSEDIIDVTFEEDRHNIQRNIFNSQKEAFVSSDFKSGLTSNNFMVAKVDGKFVDPDNGFNKNCCIIDGHEAEREKLRIIFKTSSKSIIDSFRKICVEPKTTKLGPKYSIVILKNSKTSTETYRMEGEIDENDFVKWVLQPDIFFNIFDIEPIEILEYLFDYIEVTRELLLSDLELLKAENTNKVTHKPQNRIELTDNKIAQIVNNCSTNYIKEYLKKVIQSMGLNMNFADIRFSNLNTNGTTFWSNPKKIESDNKFFYLILNNKRTNTLYIFQLFYKDLNSYPEKIRIKNNVPQYDITIKLDNSGNFINTRSGRCYSNDLVGVIHY